MLPVTDARMTRFVIKHEEHLDLVCHAFDDMLSGETCVENSPL
jgi:UDP-N-acetylglucosamine 4,6-dehydratase